MLLSIILLVAFSKEFAVGFPGLGEKIIGGDEISIFDSPYQASIHYNGAHRCGAAIISAEHVLTAAHCVHLYFVRQMTVNVGGSYHSAPRQSIPVYRFKTHHDYNNITFNNDIAIIQLVSKMAFGPYVLPIALPYQDETLPEGSVGVVAGWGQMRESIKLLAWKLRMVKLPTISKELCQNLNAPKDITDNMICATDLNGGKDTCQGDSGSGFVSKGKLFGLTSWGIGCGRREKAGVYTKVAKYRNWIKLFTGV